MEIDDARARIDRMPAAPYLLLGEKLSHSYSPEIHAMLDDYTYELKELAPSEFEPFVRARGFRGVNVTIPYKRAAYALCDRLSEEARRLGNVNTILVGEDGLLTGHNTDLCGFEYMARRCGIRVEGKKAAVLGSGGAGLTARAALINMSAREVIMVSRTGPVDYEALYARHGDAQIIVNATPVGMHPHSGTCPVRLEALPCVEGVLDMIYNPHRTALIMDAQARGIRCEDGLSMLIKQAARAKELFTGQPAPDSLVESIRVRLLKQKLNLVLIGMPGSGKTSVGLAVAARMGREFVDADAEIERSAGMTIPEIFARHGEPHFRAVEAEVLSDVGCQSSLVIATGGGAPMFEANARALRQNGELVLIERPVDQLATQGRPLSQDVQTLNVMAQARMPVYRTLSCATVDNTGSIEDAATAVMEGFYAVLGDQRAQP